MRRFFGALLQGLVWILLILGAIEAARWLIGLVSHVNFTHGWDAVKAGWHGFTGLWNSEAVIWATIVTAVATFFLWRATEALSRSTNVQQALDGPFLKIDLQSDPTYPLFGGVGSQLSAMPPESDIEMEPEAEVNPNQPSYYAPWDETDRTNPALRPFLMGTPRYVYLTVANQQSKQQGIAQAVEVQLSLYFEPAPGVATTRYQREVTLPAIAPEQYKAGPVFNVGSLQDFMVVVESVKYLDITNRTRRACYGEMFLLADASGAVSTETIVFGPRKGEFTDAIR